MSDLDLAKVVGVHPGQHAVDLVFVGGGRAPMVQVMCSMPATTNSGQSGLPTPSVSGNKWDAADGGGRSMMAVVGHYRQVPVVLGFLYPQVSQMLFEEPERVVSRTPSDVYSTTDPDGNTEWYHPSGTYLRIGESPDHEDLTGKDADGKWAIERNTERAPHMRLVVANAGSVRATVSIDPDGNVLVENAGNTSFETQGNIGMTAGGNIDIEAGGDVRVSGSRIDLN